MDERARVEQEARFVRMCHQKRQVRKSPGTIGDSLVQFYKSAVQRTRKFGNIGEVWETLLPPDLLEHTCLESYRGGILTVLVDSSPHLYRLKQLMLQDLQKRILELCRKEGLKKISLRPGRWYQGENETDRRLLFPE